MNEAIKKEYTLFPIIWQKSKSKSLQKDQKGDKKKTAFKLIRKRLDEIEKISKTQYT